MTVKPRSHSSCPAVDRLGGASVSGRGLCGVPWESLQQPPGLGAPRTGGAPRDAVCEQANWRTARGSRSPERREGMVCTGVGAPGPFENSKFQEAGMWHIQ